TIDMPSPLFTLTSNGGGAWKFPTDITSRFVLVDIAFGVEPTLDDPDDGSWIASPTISFLGLSSRGPAAVLRPGESESIAFRFRTPGPHIGIDFELSLLYPDSIRFDLGSLTADDQMPIDWAAHGADLHPPGISAIAWDAIFRNLVK